MLLLRLVSDKVPNCMTENKTTANATINGLFEAGAHFGYPKSKRHPSTSKYIFGTKNKVEIFDLETIIPLLDKAKEFAFSLGKEKKRILFVGGKNEARVATRLTATSISMPYVDGRWLGGTLTNFSEIRKRIEKMERLMSEREKGELAKYTKLERLRIDEEIEKLDKMFGGISSLTELPKALFVVDPGYEEIAVAEAHSTKIPVIAIASNDCNIEDVDFPIPANDSSTKSIEFIMKEIAEAYRAGSKTA